MEYVFDTVGFAKTMSAKEWHTRKMKRPKVVVLPTQTTRAVKLQAFSVSFLLLWNCPHEQKCMTAKVQTFESVRTSFWHDAYGLCDLQTEMNCSTNDQNKKESWTKQNPYWFMWKSYDNRLSTRLFIFFFGVCLCCHSLCCLYVDVVHVWVGKLVYPSHSNSS